jgi:hypothetical protein
VLAQNAYHLEQNRFVWTLAAFSAAAAIGAGLLLRSARAALLAGASVPATFVLYIIGRLVLCAVGIGECYGN